MSFGIHPTSRAFVERLEKLDLAQDSEEAERRQQTWMKDLHALNWERTPQTVLSELFEVEETPQQAEQAAKLQETHRKDQGEVGEVKVECRRFQFVRGE